MWKENSRKENGDSVTDTRGRVPSPLASAHSRKVGHRLICSAERKDFLYLADPGIMLPGPEMSFPCSCQAGLTGFHPSHRKGSS